MSSDREGRAPAPCLARLAPLDTEPVAQQNPNLKDRANAYCTEAALKRVAHRRTERGPTFAGELARMAGLRVVRFAVPARQYPAIQRAKLRFGTVAVAALLACLCREVLKLCPTAAVR